jgi:hypothetical protein
MLMTNWKSATLRMSKVLSGTQPDDFSTSLLQMTTATEGSPHKESFTQASKLELSDGQTFS